MAWRALHVRTSAPEEDLRHGGVQEHGEAPGVGAAEEVGGGVAAAGAVEDGATDLGAGDVVDGVAVVRGDAGLEEALAERALPARHVGRNTSSRSTHRYDAFTRRASHPAARTYSLLARV